jgi:hypothetical protein
MKRFITYGSIDQFSTIIKNVQHSARYKEFNEKTQTPIYDKSIILPKVIATGSEKIHGTNAAVCYSKPDGFWVQSRKNIIVPEKDNAGCAFQAYQNEESWKSIVLTIADNHNIDLTINVISIYFEWSGGSIQKNSALSGLNKRSIIFQYFKVSPIEPVLNTENEEQGAYWLPTTFNDKALNKEVWIETAEKSIFNIMNFPVLNVEIDFERPDLAQNEFIKILEIHEKNSPVGQQFGIDNNILEGYVWTFEYKGIIHSFKVKGEEHAVSKVKTLKPVDSEKEQIKIDFANYACKAWRLEQMYKELLDENGDVTVAMIGTFLRKVIQDVWKEESDIATEKGLVPKEVNSTISKVAKNWFMDELGKGILT